MLLILSRLVIGIGFAIQTGMHVGIERLYQFVMGRTDLTEREQSHLTRCSFCVIWLDGCAEEKVSLLIDTIRSSVRTSSQESLSHGANRR
jgi:hypothetical protein